MTTGFPGCILIGKLYLLQYHLFQGYLICHKLFYLPRVQQLCYTLSAYSTITKISFITLYVLLFTCPLYHYCNQYIKNTFEIHLILDRHYSLRFCFNMPLNQTLLFNILAPLYQTSRETISQTEWRVFIYRDMGLYHKSISS